MKNQKVMRRVLAMMLAVMLLAGCGGGATPSESPEGDPAASPDAAPGASVEETETQPDQEVAEKIIVFQSKVEITDQLEAAALAFQEESGIEVEVWGTTGDDYFQQLKTGLANNQGPTVLSVTPGAETEQIAGYLADLSDLPFAGDIAEGMASEVDGKMVGVPYTMEGFGMVYNKDLIDPAAVTDYDSFVQMLQEQQGAGINGFGLSQESYFLIGHILNHPFSIMDDMEGFMTKLNAGEVTMAETPEFQEFAKFYVAIRDNSYNPLEVNYDKECGDFATGKTASIHQGNWCYSMFADFDVTFDMGLMPFPLMGNDRLAVSVPTTWSINSQATAPEIAAGKQFLTWLYTSETGTKYLTEEFGFIPVVQGVSSDSLDPLSAEVARYASEGKTRPWATNLYPAGIVDVHLVPVAQKFFTSAMTAEEFLAELDAAWIAANA